MTNRKIPDAQFKLRLPLELKDRVEKSALESKRSINAEITGRLDRSYELQQQIDFLRTRADAEEEENFRLRNQLKSMQSADENAALSIAKDTIDSLERMVAEFQRTVRTEQYMLSQIKVMRHLLDRVAESDGKVPDQLLAIIRALSTPEAEDEMSKPSSLIDLLSEATNAIEELEKRGEWQD